MTASVTDLRRNTKKLLAAVKRGESVDILHRGKLVATLDPASEGMPAGEALRILQSLDPDPETADAIEAEILKARAERSPHRTVKAP